MAIDISDLEVPSAQQPVKQGIDISDLEIPSANPPTMVQKLSGAMTAMKPAFKAAKTLTGIVTPGSGIPEMAQELAPTISNKEGEMIAEKGGTMGYPKTAAAVGTGVSMIPQMGADFTVLQGLGSSSNPIVKGLMNSPQE
jgi:hypothetical protein